MLMRNNNKYLKLLLTLLMILSCQHAGASSNNSNKQLESIKARLASDSYYDLYSVAVYVDHVVNHKELTYAFYDKLLKKFPDKLAPLYSYKYFCKQDKSYEKAIDLNRYIYSKDKNKRLNTEYFDLYALQYGDEKLIDLGENLLKEDPENIELLEKLVDLSFKKAKFKKASKFCKKLNTLNPNSKLALACGKSHFYAKDNKSAEKIIEKQLSKKQKTYNDLKLLTDVYLSNKEYKKAEKSLKKLLQIKTNRKNLKKLGDIYLAQGKKQEAAKVFRNYLKLYPGDIPVLTKLFDTYLALGQKDKAISVGEKIISLNPNNPNVKERLAYLHLSEEDYEKTIVLLKDLTEKDKSDQDLLKLLANCYMANQNFEDANLVLVNMLKANPEDSELKRSLANNYYANKDLVNAKKLYAQLLEDSPKDEYILGYLVDISAELNDYYSSIFYLKKLILVYLERQEENFDQHIENKIYELQVRLGNFYLAQNELDKAEDVFTVVYNKDPYNYKTINTLIDIYLGSNKHVEAINLINQAMALRPDDKALKIKAVDTLFALDEMGEARLILEELVKDNPDDQELILKLVDSYLAEKEIDKAIDLLKTIADADDSYMELDVHKKLGNAYIIAGRFDDAVELYTNLSKIYPGETDIILNLIDSYLALEEYDEAYALLQPIVKENYKDIELIKKVANILNALNRFEENDTFLMWAYQKHPDNNEIKKLLGDTNLSLSNFKKAVHYYQSMTDAENNKNVHYKLAECYRHMKQFDKAERNYNRLLNYPEFKEKALIGKAYINIDKSKLHSAQKDFKKVLKNNKDNYEAKLGLAIAYISTEDYLKALNILDKLGSSPKIKYEKAVAFEKMKMYGKARECLRNNPLKKARLLDRRISNLMKIRFEPEYGFHTESFPAIGGGPNYKLKYNRYGIEVSDYIEIGDMEKTNLKWKAKFDMTPYKSGSGTSSARATATRYGFGIEGRPFKHVAVDGEIGYKSFSSGQGLIEAKGLLDLYLTDWLALNFGYHRRNVEETFLSTVGLTPITGPFAGKLVGQVVDNKYNLIGYKLKLPYNFYNYGDLSIGFRDGKNMSASFYKEAVAGIGNVLYSRPKGRLVDLVMGEYTMYYTGFDENHLGFGGASLNSSPIGSDGISPFVSPYVGGYYSPKNLLSHKMGLHLRGSIDQLRARYYVGGFLGLQSSTNQGTDFINGVSARLTINEEGPVGVELIYLLEDYHVIRKHDFIVSLLMRL